MWKKAAPAISMAFLTLMTLKLENNGICAKSTPNDHNDKKKLSKFDYPSSWPLTWPFQPFLAFYNFPGVLSIYEGQWYEKLSNLSTITLRTISK